jgi:ADP-heptose:LPS heptosyltransferase
VQPVKHILVIRFSAMGDVAMTLPVIQNILHRYPDVHITVVSNAFFAPVFQHTERVSFHPAYLKTTHKGITGMWKLFRELKKLHRFHAVADLHNVLRSSLLRKFFYISGVANAVIDKGRASKKILTAKTGKQLHPLKTSHQRYADVFAALGFPVELTHSGSFLAKQPVPEAVAPVLDADKKWIGIAPFAQHAEKLYPVESMKKVLHQLNQREDITLLFFGGGEKETALLKEWQQEFAGSLNVAGVMSFREELQLIGNLRLMVCMDSANMHLASLYHVPVVSIWGATHPYAGFYGWAQDENNIVQAALYCRPCSVFGNKPCYRGDHACMALVTPEYVLQKILAALD